MSYCDFKPGDEVVCVDDRPPEGPFWAAQSWPLRRNDTYLVVEVLGPEEHHARVLARHPGRWWRYVNEPTLLLAGAENPCGGGFGIRRFRKVQRRDLSAWLETATDFEEPRRTPAPKNERVS